MSHLGTSGSERTRSLYTLPQYRTYVGDDLVEEPWYNPPVQPKQSARQIGEAYRPALYKHPLPFDPDPEALYYRVLAGMDPLRRRPAICIQYYAYWPTQYYPWGVLQHRYDYEPILVFVEKPGSLPYKVVFCGGNLLQFHWTEIHGRRGEVPSPSEYVGMGDLAPRCTYPFDMLVDGKMVIGRKAGSDTVKVFDVEETAYPNGFEGLRLVLAITHNHHPYSVYRGPDGTMFSDLPLLEMTDHVLTGWYLRYLEKQRGENIEPFQHDVSDPIKPPHIRYARTITVSKTEAKVSRLRRAGDDLTLMITVVNPLREPIVGLAQENFGVKLDQVNRTDVEVTERDEGQYTLRLSLGAMTKGTHTITLVVRDFMGMESETLRCPFTIR